MWLKKLRQKKLQYMLVALTLFMTAAIFSTCISFTVESALFTNKAYEKGAYPDSVLSAYSKEAQDVIEKAVQKNGNLEIIDVSDGFSITSKMTVDEENITTLMPSLTILEDITNIHCEAELYDANDMNAVKPNKGEIWITKVHADSKKVKLNDIVKFEKENVELKVSGIFKSADTPNIITTSILPMYISEDTLAEFDNIILNKVYSINEKNSKDVIGVIKETMGSEYEEVSGMVIGLSSRDMMKMGSSMVSSLMGGITSLAGIIVFIVATIIIQFIIRANLIKEFKCIGTYKAIGFSNKKIRGIYAKSYIIVGIIAIVLGIALGIPFSGIFGASINADMIGYKMTSITLLISAASVILLSLILIFAVFNGTKRVKKIFPVDAFRIGTTSTKKKITKSVIKNAHSPFAVAINDIFRKKRMSIMTIIIISMSLFITTFFVGINYSCINMSQNMDSWFSLPQTDVYGAGAISGEEIRWLEDDERVDFIVYGALITSPFLQIDSKYNADEKMLNNILYTTRSEDFNKTEFECLEGRVPKGKGELALSDTIIKELKLKVGDYLDFTEDGETISYLITGRFRTMMSGGLLIIFEHNDLFRHNDQIKSDYIAIELKDGVNHDKFIDDYANKFNDIDVGGTLPIIEQNAKSIVAMTGPLTMSVGLILLIFSLLNIINIVIMENTDNRRSYGILKSLGFKTSYIITKSIAKISILSFVSVAVATLLYAFLTDKIFLAMLGVNGFIYDYSITFIISAILFVLIIAATAISCLPTRKISPTELMEE